jgi:uncharacterized protein (TIGR02646 family)
MLPESLKSDNLRIQKAKLRDHFAASLNYRQRRRAPVDLEVFSQNDVVAALTVTFEGKCAYCETGPLAVADSAVSHFRPISNATSAPDEKDSPDHYSWFAYEWRNLLLLCKQCHNYKANFFPVNGSRALPFSTWKEAEHMEDALLLNPCTDDPSRHLTFDQFGTALGRSEKGKSTIEILSLNRSSLRDERAAIINHIISRLRNPTGVEKTISGIAYELESNGAHSGAAMLFLYEVCRAAAMHGGSNLRIRFSNLSQSFDYLYRVLPANIWNLAIDDVNGNRLGFLIHEAVLQQADIPFSMRHRRSHLSTIVINNFKGIEALELRLIQRKSNASGAPATMLLGENSTGKSSLLQAVTLALLPRRETRYLGFDPEDFVSRAAGNWMLKADTSPFVQLGFDDGELVTLRYDDVQNRFRVEGKQDCIVLAYGARRIFLRRDRAKGASHVSKSLFDPMATIPDPTLWLYELDVHAFNAVARAMRSILALRDDDDIFRDEDNRVLVRAHGRVSPLEQMSDGYRSLFAMVIDIMRHMLDVWRNLEFARGLVLIDEIETHLHPRWKIRLMAALREAMPHVQFIATTHDPLCLRGMRNGEVHVLYRDADGLVREVEDLPDISTLRAEQILTSDYFGLSSTADVKQELVLMRLATLASRNESDLSPKEKGERDRLLSQFDGMPVVGNSADRQILAEAMTQHLRRSQAISIGAGRALREDAIEKIIGVLERAMKP